jgi:hypothetical protein
MTGPAEKKNGGSETTDSAYVRSTLGANRRMEIPMKKRMTNITWTTLGLVFAVLFPITTHAQVEIAPDEYKTDNMVRIEALSS